MTATPERPLVLLSNDDGYRAQGLMLLREALLTHFDVVVCAPDTEQSASSHALSLNRPDEARILQESLDEDTRADQAYASLAISSAALRPLSTAPFM